MFSYSSPYLLVCSFSTFSQAQSHKCGEIPPNLPAFAQRLHHSLGLLLPGWRRIWGKSSLSPTETRNFSRHLLSRSLKPLTKDLHEPQHHEPWHHHSTDLTLTQAGFGPHSGHQEDHFVGSREGWLPQRCRQAGSRGDAGRGHAGTHRHCPSGTEHRGQSQG